MVNFKQMRKGLIFLLFFALAGGVFAAGFESLDIINKTNWVGWFDRSLGYLYDSHGCLHFSPADMYLLYKTIPPGIPLTVKKYKLKEGDPPFPADQVSDLADKTSSPEDIAKHALTFKKYKTELVAYPSLNLLFIMVNGYPYAKVNALSGPPAEYLMAYDVPKGKPVQWDFMLTTPTDPGEYTVLRLTDHYVSSAYYQNTIVPFGAWIKKIDGQWAYQENGKWHKLPDNVVADLARPAEQRTYNYYDVNLDSSGQVAAARYAGHDFGKYVLLWTVDGKNHYPEMGYAAGELVYEQILLVKDLVHLMTVPGADDFNTVVAQNKDFTFYKGLSDFKNSKGVIVPPDVIPVMASYYKLFNGLTLNDKDRQALDPRLVKALKEYKEERLPRDQRARREALGLYNYLRVNSLVIDKQAGWYEQVKQDWAMFKELRVKLRADFDKMGVLSLENRQNLVEGWLNDRLEFRPAALPKQAKYVADLSFSAFFKPDEESRLFTEREQAVMRERISKGVKGDTQGLALSIVDALNNYNFGVLLNDILGDLYKSHGCLHVSPRNILFLYKLLPVGSQMKVYKYSERLSQEAVKGVPYLADMVNFEGDLEKLREIFAVTREVQVAVYPYSGDWLVYLKGTPFARLTIKGGPQETFYLLQGRDKKGLPQFESHLAYPTTPGDYNIFQKVENYVSNIYHDQTIIPMGGLIRREKGELIFQDRAGKWKDIPGAVAADLSRPVENREYTYYDPVRNSSGEVVEMKWGSQPFGRYAIQTTVNRKSAWPELIHSSGDLIMEERQLVNDLIAVLTAPADELDDCVKLNQNFELCRICSDFTTNPDRTDLIQPKERAAYRLYYRLPLTKEELALLPPDAVIAAKVVKNEKLTDAETNLLISERLAYRRSGKLKINRQKILGLWIDTYQYVVAIEKYAHHYTTLKRRWPELSGLRRALLNDFNTFVIKDPQLFRNFMRELMLKRNRLEKLTQENALQTLFQMTANIDN
ncbi:MAG: L,D-transpeptidase [Candidatus Margulisbacteria bacterium]|nr:L,D-transpeptidase [Candidatus Margulisiibacteriota bacterium]